MVKIILEGEMTDLNTYVHAMNKSRLGGNSIKQNDTNYVKLSCSGIDPILKPVKIHFKWFVKNKKKDPDNIAFKKSILDGLVLAGVLQNDTQKFVRGFSDNFFVDCQNPRVEIEFEEI